jgi:hypothetical protein
MSQAERGLFEQLEQYLNPGKKAGAEAERIIREFERRLSTAWTKINSAQAALKNCGDIILDQGLAAGVERLQGHREDLEQRLAEADNRIIKLRELYIECTNNDYLGEVEDDEEPNIYGNGITHAQLDQFDKLTAPLPEKDNV